MTREISKTEARQGVTTGRVRRILSVSVALAVVALVVVVAVAG